MNLHTNDDKYQTVNEIFTCIAFCKMNQTLCAGTNIGRIYFWSKRNIPETDSPEDLWELININTISGTIKQLMWGSVMLRLPILSVNCVTSVYIMKEQSISCSFSEKIWATQKTSNQILLETENSDYLLELDHQVNDIAISDQLLVCTNGKFNVIYEISWQKDKEFSSKLDDLKGENIFNIFLLIIKINTAQNIFQSQFTLQFLIYF